MWQLNIFIIFYCKDRACKKFNSKYIETPYGVKLIKTFFSEGLKNNEGEDVSSIEIKKILEEHYNPIITRIRAINKPIIAAVNGVAAGAGANIALSCDLVVASNKASFIQAFSKIGLIPDSGGTFFLPRLIGFQKATALMMLGDKVTAEEAEELGMIFKVISSESFNEEVEKLAVKLANMPTKALGLIKELLSKSMTNTLEQQLELEGKLQIKAALSEDYTEGVNAFMEKRKPIFKGK